MMKNLILNKDCLSYWLRQLRKERELIAPVKTSTGDYIFKSIEQIHKIALDDTPYIPSLKEFVFPQVEEMFAYSEKGISEQKWTEKMVIFGASPCDIAGIKLMERFYSNQTDPSYDLKHPNKFTLTNRNERVEDSYFISRRRNIIFIVIGCKSPEPTCFCDSLGSGPCLNSGFDVQLTDLGDRYFVQVGSSSGEEIVKDYLHLFEKAKKQDDDDQYEMVLSVRTKFAKRVNLEETRQKILSGKVSDSFWEKIGKRCFECGGCVYECPVCTCFNIVDKPEDKDKGKRLRIWDTCLFKGFTRMAGGNIPADKKAMRIKRWYFHKLVYYPEQFNQFGCIGCGRCAITCPGKIDLATISHKINVEIK